MNTIGSARNGPHEVDNLSQGYTSAHARRGLLILRLLIILNLILGCVYMSWRYTASINWAVWPVALVLLVAETYSFVDALLFGLTVWRRGRRGEPPAPPADATVDVFITCYNEPVELVRKTAMAARAIRWPHHTYILDDGNSPAMRAMAAELGVGYIVRTSSWQDKERHAKAGNINNALFQSQGEFILILDADQIPMPNILHRTLGYFRDPEIAFVQTPQWFYNVPAGDPFGSQAPLFYGPIQQGKDGWNAAFFCGSNAVLRREALIALGIRQYVDELEQRVGLALSTADRILGKAIGRAGRVGAGNARLRAALLEMRAPVQQARTDLRAGMSIQEVTWTFQRRVEEISRVLVREDLGHIIAEFIEHPDLDALDMRTTLRAILEDDEALATLARREASPLAVSRDVRDLLLAVDVDRDDEAQPIMPLARISVTEDMATAMRLHAAGWRSIYHHEVLARGLAPEDLQTSLQQRLRWAQGTIQVLLRENPFRVRGLRLGQRLMYFATMWSYLSGFASLIFLLAPVLYLVFGIQPVQTYSADYFGYLIPYMVSNHVLFLVVGRGLPTWRGQQYNLALFPLWIKAVLSAVANVYFGRRLPFVVTSKTCRHGSNPRLIWPQLAMIMVLNVAVGWGLGRLALGLAEDALPILVNASWAWYSLAHLSVVWTALYYRPETHNASEANSTAIGKRLAHYATAGER